MKNKTSFKDDTIQILIAEDSPTQAEKLKHILEKHHYQIIVANNGKMAFDLALENIPSLVISDIVMPEMNGYELCKAIKSNASTLNIPVIILTSLSNSEDVLEGLACGADNFLTKPYSEGYLTLLIEQIFANKELHKEEIVRVGVEISFGGKRRFITANQQQMLSLLISTYDGAVQKNNELIQTQEELKAVNDHLEEKVEERTAALLAEINVRLKAEGRILKLNRMYAVLSSMNQTIVRVHEIELLFHEFCQIAVDKGTFESAWIGTINDGTKEIIAFATAGTENNLIEVCPDNNPILHVIRLGNHFISNNITNDTSIAAIWKQNSLSFGFKSFAVFPIFVFGKVIGAFSIYSNEANFFDDVEISLLDEMANDLSFALEYIRKETIREENELALKESEEYTKRIIAASNDCIKVLDLEGNLLSMSEWGQNMLEIDDINLYLNKSWVDLWKGEDYKSALEAIALAKDGNTNVFTGFCPTAKGKPKWWEIVISPIKDDQGKINSLLAVSRDISERKKAVEDLIIAKEKAEESDQLKTAFLHNISHEVRTPMNAIIGFSDFLKNPDLTHEKRVYFTNIITQNCYQLLSIISDIITIATIEVGQVTIYQKEFDLNSMLRQLHDQFLQKNQNKNTCLILKHLLPYDEVRVISDETKLAQVLTSLINNALKFTSQGYVNFGYKVKTDEIEFFVEDTGIGIPPDKHEKIFKRFIQAEDQITREFGGSGLGLSISKAFVELIGGKIWLKSELGKGSTFYFTIPYKDIQRITIPKDHPASNVNIEYLATKTILIAEDEESNYLLLEEVLSNLNIKLIWAKNGEEAIEICKSQEVDLILMDLKMPIMDGYEATLKIKDFKPKIPIIAQTAFFTDYDKKKAFICGCTDYISKPIKKATLIAKINEHLNDDR